MPYIKLHPIQKSIIWLTLSLLAIVAIVLSIDISLRNKSDQIKQQLNNQAARQEIGISIYQRLFSAKAYVLKINLLEDRRELEVVKHRFDINQQVIIKGLEVLQNGGLFEDEIAINIPGSNSMQLLADYKKPRYEGYVLEVLELGPAIDELDEQVAQLVKLVESRMQANEPSRLKFETHLQNLIKVIDTTLQRSQEHAARVLFDTHKRSEKLSVSLKQAEEYYDGIRVPMVLLAVCLAIYLLLVTLSRVAKVIDERKQAEEQLQLLLDTTVEGIYGIDMQGRTTFVNPAASSMLGFTSEELIGKENHSLIHHSHRDGSHYPADDCRMLQVIHGGILQTVDNEVFWRKDGTPFPVEYSSNPIEHNREIIGAVVSFRDISERKQTERQIRTLSQAVEQSPVTVIITDVDANIEYVNSAFERVTGYSAAEVIGQNPRILNSGNTPTERYTEMWKALVNGKTWSGEFHNRKKNGEVFWERAYMAPVLDNLGNITHYLAVEEDISTQKLQEEQILHQANYDSLTDLPNRFLTLDRLSQMIKESLRNGSRAAVFFLDLDDFKKINDTMSHEVGDHLLIQAAARLRDVMRDEDTVSRLGGDEFVMLMGSLSNAEDAYPVAEKILECFRNPFHLDGRELVLTVSIGISIFPDDGDNPATLLRNADTAMYHSKEQGRNTYNYFTDAMNKGVSRRLHLEEQLHGALERNEFTLHYQPLLDVKTRSMVAAEALLRWHNPTLGEVSPEEFIPIAEHTGQITPIGIFVLNEALKMTAQWQKQYKDFKIAINISPRQFRDPNLLQHIKDGLEHSGVSSKYLELEITEGVLMSGHAYIDETLGALSNLGVGISMDDFGTGYSSLSYLRSYPFDTLKIDRSFVSDITSDPADAELVNAAIAMAHSLGLAVVAEGVETEQQLALLTERGCEYAQGELFSKPVPADQIAKRFNNC